jgi:hypothetical protein
MQASDLLLAKVSHLYNPVAIIFTDLYVSKRKELFLILSISRPGSTALNQ